MSENDNDQAGSEQTRDDKGKFTKQTKTDNSGSSGPKTSDYTKMNSYLAKQLGLADKLADFQTKFDPSELFNQLTFMADNSTNTPASSNGGSRLPPNQPIAPVSPPAPKFELPGTQLHKPDLSKENFSVSYEISPSDLIKPKKE